MNNELLQKIQEKLGSVMDLINLENTEKVYNYAIFHLWNNRIGEKVSEILMEGSK